MSYKEEKECLFYPSFGFKLLFLTFLNSQEWLDLEVKLQFLFFFLSNFILYVGYKPVIFYIIVCWVFGLDLELKC